MNIELRIPTFNDPAIERPAQPRGPLNRPSMTRVDRDAFIREFGAEPAVHAGLIRAAVRAFLAAALLGQEARTPGGWRSVIQDLRYVLGSAMGAGVRDRRPTRSHLQVEAVTAGEQGLPVRLIYALVRAYVAGRMSSDEGATPEGRSRILGETRELVWDGMLDAVKQVPCPPPLRPRKSAPAPRQTPPGRKS
jgi:hypothetical protein